jgi:hypothetical protein
MIAPNEDELGKRLDAIRNELNAIRVSENMPAQEVVSRLVALSAEIRTIITLLQSHPPASGG